MELKLKIKRDDDPMHPRKECDNAGRMVCWHRRYTLGDEQPREEPADWKEAFDEEHPNAVILPLYLYDHGGITISTGAFACAWDSGQVGWIYITREALDKEWPAEYPADATSEAKQAIDEQRIEKALVYLRAEVKTYDDYLNGNVWGFELVKKVECDHGDEHEEHEDSCWGFFGDDAKDCIRDHLSEEARPLLDDAWDARE